MTGRRQTWVALLRGINLGARNRISMPDLRQLFADLGAEDVTTYVQSGNVVFHSSGSGAGLTRKIEAEIQRRLGLEVAVLLRTQSQLKKLVDGSEFAERESDPAKLHVTFLEARPERSRVRALEEKSFEPDEFHVAGDAVYLYCPNGYGRSKLSNAFFEKQLGVAATTRNWRTVTALAELKPTN
jgi:uncharacterized protein (DUF1697 family)